MPRHHDYGPMSEHPPDDPATQPCEHPGCHGDAYDEHGFCEHHHHAREEAGVECPACGGHGVQNCHEDDGSEEGCMGEEPCDVCHGAGVVGKGE